MQEPYFQPPVNHVPELDQWVHERKLTYITASSGSNRAVTETFGNTDPDGSTTGVKGPGAACRVNARTAVPALPSWTAALPCRWRRLVGP